MPYACRAITQDMRHIHSLKHRFDITLNDALNGRDITPALELKDELKAAIEALYRETWPFDSPELTMERVIESVRHYRSLYESTGVINASGESVLRLPGEDTDRHYPIPTEAQVVDYLRSQTNHETIKHLLELGLVKLAIVPLSGFGNAGTISAINDGRYNEPTVPPLVRAVGEKLRQKFNAHELTVADGTPVTTVSGTYANNGRNFIYVNPDNYVNTNLTYRHGVKPDPNDATKTVSDWKPLDFMLDPANHATPFPGWQLMLVPTDPTLTRQYPTDNRLSALNANQRVDAYEAKLTSIPGLTGWTPEMELLAYLERLNRNGPIPVLHDWENPTDGLNTLLGVTFNGDPTGDRPGASWRRGYGRLSFYWSGPGYRLSDLGALPLGEL